MDENKFRFVVNEGAIVTFHCPLHHILEKMVPDETRGGEQHAACDLKIYMSQNSLNDGIIKFMEALTEKIGSNTDD